MARVSLCIVLLSAVLAFSQQQPQSQDTPTTATANSSGNKSPSQDDSQNQSKADANERIQNSIQNLLSDDPILDGVDVQASVNDESIILTGTVASYAQHQRVLQLAAQYGRWRKIDDRVKMQ